MYKTHLQINFKGWDKGFKFISRTRNVVGCWVQDASSIEYQLPACYKFPEPEEVLLKKLAPLVYELAFLRKERTTKIRGPVGFFPEKVQPRAKEIEKEILILLHGKEKAAEPSWITNSQINLFRWDDFELYPAV